MKCISGRGYSVWISINVVHFNLTFVHLNDCSWELWQQFPFAFWKCVHGLSTSLWTTSFANRKQELRCIKAPLTLSAVVSLSKWGTLVRDKHSLFHLAVHACRWLVRACLFGKVLIHRSIPYLENVHHPTPVRGTEGGRGWDGWHAQCRDSISKFLYQKNA